MKELDQISAEWKVTPIFDRALSLGRAATGDWENTFYGMSIKQIDGVVKTEEFSNLPSPVQEMLMVEPKG